MCAVARLLSAFARIVRPAFERRLGFASRADSPRASRDYGIMTGESGFRLAKRGPGRRFSLAIIPA
jgi:hypothetical protein